MLQTANPTFRTRADAISWARDVAEHPTSIFLDTETTGLGPTAEICDIAIVDRHGNVLLDTLVKPRKPIPVDASRIHGITDAMVANAPEWDDLYWWFAPIVITSQRIVVYNSAFDYGVVAQCCRQDGIQPPMDRWECAMKAYSAFDGTIGRNGLKWHKLAAASERFGITPGTHRALADAQACRQVVMAMAGAT